MKKKVDKDVLNESCFMMNIPKTLNSVERNYISNSIPEDCKIPLQNSLTPPQSISNSPNNKIKFEKEDSPQAGDEGDAITDKSPPISSLGPGAEIKGKICHPIPSSSKLEEAESLEEICKSAGTVSPSGGRLTFFREGKLLLELSHRSEQGSWVQVKSKTYWPPPSTTTTTTTIQHPLRHDTPTTHSDDCSSVNSSPWSSDHVRKQIGPSPKTKVWVSNEHLFYIRKSPFIRAVRRKVRLRRNPFSKIVGPIDSVSPVVVQSDLNSSCTDVKFNERKKRVECTVTRLRKRVSLLPQDNDVSIRSLFERIDGYNSEGGPPDPTFVTPRKRYLRTMESDVDPQTRKRVNSSLNSVSSKICDRLASPSSFAPPPKSAISSHNSSAYSIDSLLSSENESSRRNESFLRTLLKSDKHRSSPAGKSHRDRASGVEGAVKVERGGSPYPKERKETAGDHKKGPAPAERFDLHPDLSRYSPHANLNSLYLNPYFDPRYVMLHSLGAAPSFLPPVSQSGGDMASAVAVAAAAAVGYPINPLHLSALTANTLLPGALPPNYSPATSLASQLIRSPTPNRSSPLSVPHSPSPKLSPAPPPLPSSPHLGGAGSPLDRWTPSSIQNSPQKYPSTSSTSPPPQDVPLNLSKPKQK